MTKVETVQILAIIKAGYPQWGRDLKKDDATNMIMLWSDMLKDYSFEIVQMAVKTLISSSKWPPAIAEVIDKCNYINDGGVNELSEVEAWAIVKSAIRSSTYHSLSNFENLPPVIQQTLRTHETLRDWAQLPGDEVDTVVASNFMRGFRTTQKNAKEYKALPSDVKAKLMDNPIYKLIGN